MSAETCATAAPRNQAMNGKTSKPRPYSKGIADYGNEYDRIFRKPASYPASHPAGHERNLQSLSRPLRHRLLLALRRRCMRSQRLA